MFATVNQTVSRFIVGTVGTALCATVCLLGATVPAHAGTVGEPSSLRVSYADLNLSSTEGRATLDRRIHNAAKAVCSTGGESLSDRARDARCVRQAINGAMPKVAAITSAHAG